MTKDEALEALKSFVDRADWHDQTGYQAFKNAEKAILTIKEALHALEEAKQAIQLAYSSGYSAAKQQRTWVELTKEEYTNIAHRTASKYAHRTDPTFIAYTFLPHTLEHFVQLIEKTLKEKNK